MFYCLCVPDRAPEEVTDANGGVEKHQSKVNFLREWSGAGVVVYVVTVGTLLCLRVSWVFSADALTSM